jgi:hypothetical protein
MANALCMPGNRDYIHTLRLCNTYCFFHCSNVNVTFMLTLPGLFFLGLNNEDNFLAGTRPMPYTDHALITTDPAVADGIIGPHQQAYITWLILSRS